MPAPSTLAQREPLLPHDMLALLARARALKRAALAGRTPLLLRGRIFGLVCERSDAPDAQRFCRAVHELGARVSEVRPVLDERSSAHDVRQTAQLLGRLYDAVEFQGSPPGLVRRVADEAGVPVYDGVASARHPTAGLADMLGSDGESPDDNRRYVLQAVLVDAVS